MGFVLSVVHPPKGGAGYGKAEVPEQDPFETFGSAVKMIVWILGTKGASATVGDAQLLARVATESPGKNARHEGSGLTFRLHNVGDGEAPHPCPCCARLVPFEKDSRCDGCSPRADRTPACLPLNTAHTATGD